MCEDLFVRHVICLGLILLLSGCVPSPSPEAFFQPISLEQRQIKSRVFETVNEVEIMKACSAVLLDNGFQIQEAESRLGWISSVKIKFTPGIMPVGVGATLLVHPASGRPNSSVLRVSFHGIDDADIYQQFFALVSKSLFIKAEQI